MADFTPHLGLKRSYPEDDGDVMDLVFNWNLLDRIIADLAEGHTHDGEDSPPVDPTNLDDILRRLLILERRVDQHDIDLAELWAFIRAFYAEFQRHNHVGVDTIWIEMFQDYLKHNRELSTAIVTPSQTLLTLPDNYDTDLKYYYVSIPVDLNRDPDPDPAMPTEARMTIIRNPKGTVLPYIAIGNNLTPLATQSNFYPGAVAGSLVDDRPLTQRTVSKHDYAGKRVLGPSQTNSSAYHWRGINIPALIKGKWTLPSGRRKKFGAFGYLRFDSTEEFSQAEYMAVSMRDGANVHTSPFGTGITGDVDAILDEIEFEEPPRPLYDHDVVLCWHKRNNTWHWLHAESQLIEQILPVDLGPLDVEDLIEVAACRDPRDGAIYILQTRIVRIDSPPGHFDVEHRLVKWDVEAETPTFTEGPWWRSARLKRFYWPAIVIAPTRLEISGDRLYMIFEADWNRLHVEGRASFINYYSDFIDYPWFPFRAVYSEQQMKTTGGPDQAGDATFAIFNPGILATVTTMNLQGNWIPSGGAKIIKGNYRPDENPWASMDTEAIEAFEGANDKLYLGKEGSKLYFYQAFVPYNGADVMAYAKYKDPAWRSSYPDRAWNGIVTYDLDTDTIEYARGSLPFRVNVGGTLGSGKAILQGGQELVKQIYYPATDTVVSGDTQEQNIRAAATAPGGFVFWVDRSVRGVKVSSVISARSINQQLLSVTPNDAGWNRITTSEGRVITLEEEGADTPNLLPFVVSARGVVLSIGGMWILSRKGIRVRRLDFKFKKLKKWRMLGLALGANTYASQIYVIEDIDLTDPDSVVRFHAKGRKVGGLPFPFNTTSPNQTRNDITLSVFRDPEWVDIPLTEKSGEEYEWESTVAQLDNAFEDALVVRLNAPPEFRAGIETDYVYAELEIRAHEYKYEWTNLPQGAQAGIVLECSNPQQVERGVEGKAVMAVINSSY